jgi:hypothetical protein
MTDTPLEGKTALVTGASSGIGRATARRLARDGADVAVAARRKDRLETLAENIETEFDRRVLVAPTDVSDPAAVEATVEATVEAFGGLDVVVANAGINRMGDVEEMSIERYRSLMDVNVDGTFFTARASIPPLRESSGLLIFVASFAGNYPIPYQPVYAASKWWTRGFALSLSGYLGEDDVGVTIVNPTEVDTEIGIQDGQPAHQRFEGMETATPDDLADAIAFAARQEPPNVVSELNFYRRNAFSGWSR